MESHLKPLRLQLGMIATVILILTSSIADAQDYKLKPTYGTVRLDARFRPDPYVKKLIAGGSIQTKQGGVRAYVAKTPDFRLHYKAGKKIFTNEPIPLMFLSHSNSDTTLLINLPNGKWIANDDGGKGFNPLIRLNNPPSGQYDIWVGTFGKKFAPASLYITERSSFTPPDQKGLALNNVESRIKEIVSVPVERKLERTNSNQVLNTYNAITEHIQGITKVGSTYIISHSVKRGKKPLLVSVGGGRTTFHLKGDTKFNHVGAIQACGNLVVMPVERYYDGIRKKHDGKGSEIRFLDYTDPHNPILLSTKISRSNLTAAAAGIAYHTKHRCHYVLAVDGRRVSLYKSNGNIIGDSACRFTEITPAAGIRVEHGSQGGMQLLYDMSGKLYLACMSDRNDRNTIQLYHIVNPDEKTVQFKHVCSRDLGPQESSSFRWGGALVPNQSGTRLEALAAQRLLLVAPGVANYTWINSWTPDVTITLKHRAGYVANFRLTWTVNGKQGNWFSGDKTLGYSTTRRLPEGASNVRLQCRYAAFIKTWRDLGKKKPGNHNRSILNSWHRARPII